MKNHSTVLLITVDNDAESRLILEIALAAGIAVVRSAQPHGASLEKESGIFDLVKASRKTEVWTVEIPGIAIENRLRRNGIKVIPIDHHTYSTLDRAHDEHGKRKPSSLEQFLNLTEINDDDLRSFGFNPRLVLGIGVMDDRFTHGLRSEGFVPEEVRRVLAYREELDRQVNPNYDLVAEIADTVWKNRDKRNGFLFCKSTSTLRVSYAVCTRSIADALEEHPLVLADRGGRQIYVSNVEPNVIQKLEKAFEGHRTFTYALGRCWGIDNDAENIPTVNTDDIFAILTRD